jgi:uncharacterized protein (TIGR00255 family)
MRYASVLVKRNKTMQSMTGYAYKEAQDSDVLYSVEIKSYNARFLDVFVGLPPYLSRLENPLKKKIDARVRRGKIEASVKIKTPHSAQVAVDSALASTLKRALDDMAGELGLNETASLSLLASLPGVILARDDCDIEQYKQCLEPLFESALDDFIADREREGGILKTDILLRVQILENTWKTFESYQQEMENVLRESVAKKFREVLGDSIDEKRVLAEIAALLVKNTITEEVTRLKSHIESLKSELDSIETPGRKIDFICQEINREINTIGAKNQNIAVGKAVVNAKDALESIREQIRNIE